MDPRWLGYQKLATDFCMYNKHPIKWKKQILKKWCLGLKMDGWWYLVKAKLILMSHHQLLLNLFWWSINMYVYYDSSIWIVFMYCQKFSKLTNFDDLSKLAIILYFDLSWFDWLSYHQWMSNDSIFILLILMMLL